MRPGIVRGSAVLLVICALCMCREVGFAQTRPDDGRPTHADNAIPGDAPPWTKLKAAYDVDSKKDLDMKEEPRKAENAFSEHLIFNGPDGEKVPGAFLRPKADGVYPVVLLLHGLTSSKDTILKAYGVELVSKGFAVVALDAPHHGERKKEDDNQIDPTNFGDAIYRGCKEYRRVLDWLETRKDVDMKHVGLLGYSMGAIMGAILGGVDERIKDFVLCVGGDPVISFVTNVPIGKRDGIYTISPSLFVSHISPRPILMLNGKQDLTMSLRATMRLYDCAKDPKTLEWYDSAHILPVASINRSARWLVEKLKPTP